MAFNLRNRSFLKEIDFTPGELRYLAPHADVGRLPDHARSLWQAL